MRFLLSAVFAVAVLLQPLAVAADDAHKESVAKAGTEVPDHPVLTRSNVDTLYGLIDQTGKPVSRDDFCGRFVLVVFGYTACPDVCPTAMTHVTSVMERLGDRAKFVKPVFVTFDPARDTADVLGEYVSHFDDRTVALTGSPEKVREVQHAFGVLAVPGPKDEDGMYFIAHSAAKYLISPDGKHRQSFDHDVAPEKIAGYLEKIFSHMGM
ncbi:MAG: SCO family protein [Alphaproteobacteria bacterium]